MLSMHNVEVDYALEVSKSSDFSTLVDGALILVLVTDTFYTIVNLSYNTYYYYRVRSVVSNDSSLWSDFSGVLTSPSAPVIVVSNVTNSSLCIVMG